jgi:hypothetical protein
MVYEPEVFTYDEAPTPPRLLALLAVCGTNEEFTIEYTEELPTQIELTLAAGSNIAVPLEEYIFWSVRLIASSPVLKTAVFGSFPATDERFSWIVVLAIWLSYAPVYTELFFIYNFFKF